MQGYIVGLGGTFDHLHPGHEKLLEIAFNIGKKVVIGLTTDNMIKEKEHSSVIQSFREREKNLVNFADKLGRKDDLTIIPLNDPFGPAITDPSLDIHVSSEETFEMAMKINELRRKNGLKPLILVMVPMELKEDGTRYSSTEIRKNLLGQGK